MGFNRPCAIFQLELEFMSLRMLKMKTSVSLFGLRCVLSSCCEFLVESLYMFCQGFVSLLVESLLERELFGSSHSFGNKCSD